MIYFISYIQVSSRADQAHHGKLSGAGGIIGALLGTVTPFAPAPAFLSSSVLLAGLPLITFSF